MTRHRKLGCPVLKLPGKLDSDTDRFSMLRHHQPRLLYHSRVLEPPVAASRRARPLRLHELRRDDVAGNELRGTLALDVRLERHRTGTSQSEDSVN
jgi:hypothetical protein